jgi:predicted permease
MHNYHAIVSGYDPDHVLQFDVDPGLARYDAAKLNPTLQQMMERIKSIPGVRSASLSCCGNNFMTFTDKDTGRRFAAQFQWVSEEFFNTLGVPLLMGRGFTPADGKGARPVVIVNEAFLHANFPDSSPIGKTANGEIIGVVRDAAFGRFKQRPAPAIYWTYRQGGFGRMTFRIRTNTDPASVFPQIRQTLMQVDSHLPISNVRTLAEQVDRGLAQENMFAGLSTLFGILALILTSVGFYGIMAYSVARRTNEIGVRMALGARGADVLRLVMSEGLVLVMIGVGLGIGGALASTRYIESILFGLAPDDGATIVAVVLLMLGIAALAAFIPARRASRVDPLVALRYE